MNANELLLCLSARNAGSWAQFKAAVEKLRISESMEEALEESDAADESTTLPLYHILKFNLQRLGHVEFNANECRDGWRVVPPVIAVTRQNNTPVGIICGARSTKLLEGLIAAGCERESDPHGLYADIIRVRGENIQNILSISQTNGLLIQEDAPENILHSVPPIGAFCFSHQELPSGDRWKAEVFLPKELSWNAINARSTKSLKNGLFRFTRYGQPEYYLRLEGKTFSVPNHAIGKYEILQYRKKGFIRYDRTRQNLVFPLICRPPLLVERALILCTGTLPRTNNGVLTYSQIPEGIAGIVAEKLRQEIL